MLLLLQTIVNGIVDGLAYSLMSSGLTLVFGIGRVINFAHGELFTLGAYIAIILVQNHFSYLFGSLISIILVGFVGVIIETLVIRRLRRLGASIWSPFLATLALLNILQSLYLIIFSPNPYILNNPFAYVPINIFSITISGQDLIILIVFLLSICLLNWFLKKTKYGIAMKAISQDREASLLMGINIENIYKLTWFLGAMLSALAGILLTPKSTVDPYIGRVALLKGLCVVIIGGLGSIEGAILGGIFLGLTESLASVYLLPTFKDVFGYLFVILILLLKPRGILGKSLRRG
jgi:branched-chain amino acid transport system permease protein